MKPLVIIGTGLGGYSLAREVRKLDPDRALVLISADDGRYYSKPMLSNAYTSGKTPRGYRQCRRGGDGQAVER